MHEQGVDQHLKVSSLPPLTCERISKFVTHDPNAAIAQFVSHALTVSEQFDEDDSVEDMCVVCNSDIFYILVTKSFIALS